MTQPLLQAHIKYAKECFLENNIKSYNTKYIIKLRTSNSYRYSKCQLVYERWKKKKINRSRQIQPRSRHFLIYHSAHQTNKLRSSKRRAPYRGGYRKYGTHARVLSLTPAHGNSKYRKLKQRIKESRKYWIVKQNSGYETNKSRSLTQLGPTFPLIGSLIPGAVDES